MRKIAKIAGAIVQASGPLALAVAIAAYAEQRASGPDQSAAVENSGKMVQLYQQVLEMEQKRFVAMQAIAAKLANPPRDDQRQEARAELKRFAEQLDRHLLENRKEQRAIPKASQARPEPRPPEIGGYLKRLNENADRIWKEIGDGKP